MKKFLSRMVMALATSGLVAAVGLSVASTASAASGYCGYYSESRAVNSTCSTYQVRSIVVVSQGNVSYGPWVNQGSTSWQPYSYPSIQGFSYGLR